MSRPRTQSSDRWYLRKGHRYYYFGYCYRRDDRVHVHIIKSDLNPFRFRFSLGIPWTPGNKEYALQELEKAIDFHFTTKIKDETIGSVSNEPVMLSDLVDKYYKLFYQEFPISTKYLTDRTLKYFFEDSDFYLEDIDKIRNHIEDKLVGIKRQYHPNYIRKLTSHLSRVFKYAHSRGMIKYNPVLIDSIPEIVNYKKISYTTEQVLAIINYFKAKQKYDMYYLCRYHAVTGVRLVESLRFFNTDIDKQNNIITIHGKGTSKMKVKTREFPMSIFPELFDIVEGIQDTCMDKTTGKMFPWIASVHPHEHLRTAKRELGINVDKGFHPIRAWRENHLIKVVGIAPHIVAELLGHTQVVQREHYVTALGGKVIESLVNQ
ncbi:MAG: tyrosine-type recombinase/integrase [Candidatus Kapabacteria bacterium]|nr:tyrosine-type recombinase/integrase [Candidatus Kapabacteria bacterium]